LRELPVEKKGTGHLEVAVVCKSTALHAAILRGYCLDF
jgi:hypothetical protein